MSDHDVLRAQQVLRRHGVPVIGDVRLISKGRHGVEVHVEVNGVWRLAIRETHDCTGCLISHYVACDGAKPLDWPEATLDEPEPEPAPPPMVRAPRPLAVVEHLHGSLAHVRDVTHWPASGYLLREGQSHGYDRRRSVVSSSTGYDQETRSLEWRSYSTRQELVYRFGVPGGNFSLRFVGHGAGELQVRWRPTGYHDQSLKQARQIGPTFTWRRDGFDGSLPSTSLPNPGVVEILARALPVPTPRRRRAR